MDILDAIIEQLKHDLDIALAASERAHQTATDKENIPENKYDTLALEAAYLAHGQSKRIDELQQSLFNYQRFTRPNFTSHSAIQLGAIVTLEDEQEQTQHVFIGPDAGGLKFNFQNKTLTVVTPQTPLGKAILNLKTNDECQLYIQDKTIHYYIMHIE